MSPMRQQAIKIVEQMPEDKIYDLINILKNIEGLMAPTSTDEKSDAQIAYQELNRYRRKGLIDRDYKEELYAALKEKYANFH